MQSSNNQANNPPAAHAPAQKWQQRRKPKQDKSREPVAEEAVNIPRTKSHAPRKGIAASLGQAIPRGNPQVFKPSSLSTVGSSERNDPLLTDAILVDGLDGAVESAKNRTFKLDFSQYIQIIKSTYQVMTRLDRSLQKYLSMSQFQYYCVILLWKRLLYVLTEKGGGVNEYASLERTLPAMSIPDEIGFYLDGVGNVKDYNSNDYYLLLQDVLRLTQYNGISGTFGRVDAVSHISYETLPSPFVSVQRMLWDLALTKGARGADPVDVDANWDLPVDVRPDGSYHPNKNLLGWDLARAMTSEQVFALEDAGLDVVFNNRIPDFHTGGVTNILGLPLIIPLLTQISQLLSGSKSPHNNHAEATSYKGSLAQIGFIRRDGITPRTSGATLPAVYQRDGTAMFHTMVSTHMCSSTSLFRYRVDRMLPGANDSLCYTGPNGGAPNGWVDNANDIYNFCPQWNENNRHTAMTNGVRIATGLSEKTRRIAPL